MNRSTAPLQIKVQAVRASRYMKMRSPAQYHGDLGGWEVTNHVDFASARYWYAKLLYEIEGELN